MSNRTIHVSLGYHDGFYGVFLGGGDGGGVSFLIMYYTVEILGSIK